MLQINVNKDQAAEITKRLVGLADYLHNHVLEKPQKVIEGQSINTMPEANAICIFLGFCLGQEAMEWSEEYGINPKKLVKTLRKNFENHFWRGVDFYKTRKRHI